MARKKTGTGTDAGTSTGTELSEEQVREVVKKKRGAHWMQELSEDGGDVQPGDNSRFVRYALASWNLPPIDISDPKQVEKRIGMYFSHCVDNDRRPQIVGMCNWLGISRQTLNEWVNGEVRSSTHGDIIKKAYRVMEEMWSEYMQYGKISPPTAIFLAKNWFNYSDTQQIVVTPNNPYQATSDEELKGKYLEDIPEDE